VPTTSHTSEEVRELDLLNHRYADLVRECRLESLGERLRRRPIEVLQSRAGFGGDRWVLFLEDGSALRIKLYWRCRALPATLVSLAWREGRGWQAVVRTGQGEVITVLGFYAELHLPRGVPAVP